MPHTAYFCDCGAQNVVPFVLLLLSKLLQDYATTLLFMAVLLHGRLELDRRFTNQVWLRV